MLPATNRMNRHVPLALALQALFSGFLNQFGWFFFGFGMILVWGVLLRSEAVTFWKFQGQLASVPGVVTGSVDTGSSEGGGEHTRGTPIYAIDYRYTLPGGEELSGRAYQLGEPPELDTAVTVEYNAARPHYSRIRGMRSAVFAGWISLLALIFPLFGFVLLVGGLRRGLRALHVMRHGVPVMADLVEIRKTNMEINKRPVYAMIFSFSCQRGETYTCEVRTLEPERYSDTVPPDKSSKFVRIDENQARQEKAIVLYDPANPSVAFAPEEFGPQIRVDARGNIHGCRPASGVLAAIVPLLVIVGHGWYAVSLLAR